MIHDQILIIDNSQQHLLFCCKCLRGAATLYCFSFERKFASGPSGQHSNWEKKRKEKCQEWKNTHQTLKTYECIYRCRVVPRNKDHLNKPLRFHSSSLYPSLLVDWLPMLVAWQDSRQDWRSLMIFQQSLGLQSRNKASCELLRKQFLNNFNISVGSSKCSVCCVVLVQKRWLLGKLNEAAIDQCDPHRSNDRVPPGIRYCLIVFG